METQPKTESSELSRSKDHVPAVAIETFAAAQRRLLGQSGVVGWALLWLLGIPLPVLLIIYLIRGH
jgi:hypothetical protein